MSSKNLNNSLEIIIAKSREEFASARSLFLKYANEIGIDLSFQNFQDEIDNLSAQYSLPDGLILLLKNKKNIIGCVGLRKFNARIGEIKRLYIEDDYRGKGLSRILMNDILNRAKQMKYKCLRLDTLAPMKEADNLYKSLGFKKIHPYRYNPEKGAKYFELKL